MVQRSSHFCHWCLECWSLLTKQAADHLMPPSGPSGLTVPDQHCHLLDWAQPVPLSVLAPIRVELGKFRPMLLAASATVDAPHAAAKRQRTPT